jgi:hypothetical protein
LNLSGKKTPDVSLHPAPDTDRVNAIDALLREAKELTRKPALKLLVRVVLFLRTVLISVFIQVQLRDIPMCPITGLEFSQPEHKKLGMSLLDGVGPELAHILPFSLHSKVRRAIFFSKDGSDGSRRPKRMWPSKRSPVIPSLRKTLLNLLIPPKMHYFCNMTPIGSTICYLHGASRLCPILTAL